MAMRRIRCFIGAFSFPLGKLCISPACATEAIRKESKNYWVVPGAAPALLRSLLGLQPHLRSASAQAEQVQPALAGGCDPESLALHAAHVRSMGRLRGHIPGGAPVPRSGVPSSHPHLAQRASRNLIRASLTMPNRLAEETSPYLQQHADNPVNWHPWGEEALRLAREQDKPILLSVGYSACHWCHVMAHES